MPDQATERTTIDASPERVLEAALAFEDYPSWAHDIKETEVVERDVEGRGTKVRYRAAAMGRSTTYVLGYDYSELPRTLSWQLLESDITRQLDGSYEFAPAEGDAGRTEVTYHLPVELVVPLPSFVKRRAETRIVHTALRELKAWVERDAAA